MNFILRVVCKCGSLTDILPKKVRNEHEGKVYEDYVSISDGAKRDPVFIVEQHHENELEFACKNCKRKKDLSL